jgi:hypothetical protein
MAEAAGHPDRAVLMGGEGRPVLAVELERTAKGRRRLRGILRAYVAARHVVGVCYHAGDGRVSECLREEVESQRTARLIELRKWDGRPGGAQAGRDSLAS